MLLPGVLFVELLFTKRDSCVKMETLVNCKYS